MTLLAAFQTLLHRYTGKDDIIVGTPIAGRTRLETERLIGFFVNMLVLRTDTSGDPTFRELLRRVKEVAIGAYAHQDVPFEAVVNELQPRRDLSRNPLFQVAFALQNFPTSSLSLSAFKVTRVNLPKSTSRFDLEVQLQETEDGIDGIFNYNTSLFEAETIARITRHFRRVLESVVNDADRRLSRLPLLTERERHQLLVEWNQTSRDFPRHSCVHHIFEAQVERSPEAVAVEFDGGRLTYQELNARADEVAHCLRNFDVGPDSLVGLCVDRSLEMVVGLLGILKAGAAYLPLDPTHPVERLAFMANDARVSVLLTVERLNRMASEVTAQAGVQGTTAIVCLDRLAKFVDKKKSVAHAPRSSPENLACLMYTSGSTGRPKGAEVTHLGIVRLVKGSDYVSFAPEEVFLQLAPLAFDASTFEIWGSLLNGARLVIMSPGTPTLEEIGQAIRTHGVTTLWLTAGLFELMVEERLDDLKPLRQLVTGGDVASVTHVNRARRELQGCRLINGYGPTESTTFACCYEVKTGVSGRSVPIGRPIANTQVYILDAHLQPAPIGVSGEVYIGGDGVARGYLGQPALTADRFIADPFSEIPGSRLYRTGDRARYLHNGNIEFMGRLDHQVKIRGFRIETGEIETVLATHPNVRQAAVIAKQDRSGSKYLLASIVRKSELETSSDDLRQFLSKTLPDYMIPTAFVFLKSLPLTASGKVDRKALPDRSRGDCSLGQTTPPRTELERQLVKIWQESLETQSISVRDSFFHLGGHSLLAVRLINAINKALNLDLQVLTLFRNPTIEELARAVEAQRPGRQLPTIFRLQDGSSGPPLFFINTGAFEFRLARLLDAERSIFGTDAPLSRDVLQASEANKTTVLPRVEDLAAEHVKLLIEQLPAGSCLLAGYSFGGVLAFEVAHQLQRTGRRVEAIFLLDAVGSRRHGLRAFKYWCATHIRNTFKNGLGYPVKTTVAKVQFERRKLAMLKNPHPNLDDPSNPIPWGLIEKVYTNAREAYRPHCLDSRGVLFRAQDTKVSRTDRALGWKGLFTQGIEIVDVPGDHTTCFQEPHIQTLAQRLNIFLQKYRDLT
jgi:aspartate racemase